MMKNEESANETVALPVDKSYSPLDKLAPENIGGIHGGRGYQDQSVYIALLAIKYIESPSFVALTPEGLDDLDVKWIDGEVVVHEFHQVKNHHLTPGQFKEILQRFKARRDRLGSAHTVRNIVSAPSFSSHIESLHTDLQRFREQFHNDLPEVKEDTEKTLRERISRLELDEFADLLLYETYFFDDWFGMKTPNQQLERLTMSLIKSQRYRLIPAEILNFAAYHLLANIDHYRNHTWTRQEFADVIEQAVDRYRRPEAVAVRDGIIVHQWSRDITGIIPPERAQLAARRVHNNDVIFRQVTLPFQGHSAFPANARFLIEEAADKGGPLARALEEYPSADVLLMGVIEIPFGLLTGYLVGDGRRLKYFEYDRDTGEYNWREPENAEVTQRLSFTRANVSPIAEEAFIRLSFSNRISEEQCYDWVRPADPSLHMSLEQPEKDLLISEEQLLGYVKEIRRNYEAFKNDLPKLRHLHLFLAAPMSLVFNIGRLLKSNDMPPMVTVYHYKNPAYVWGLEITAASNRFSPDSYRIVELPPAHKVTLSQE